MKDNELISVIVPVYNVKSYVQQCIESIINQTYKNIEVIVVDDGSTDGSYEICKMIAAKDTRIRLYKKINGGLSDTRNFGMIKAKGNYYSFIDSDDWISPEMLEKMYSSCKENNSEIAICGYKKVYKNRNINCYAENAIYDRNQALSRLIENKSFQDHAWCILSKASLWEDIKYPVGKLYEDVRTTYKIFLKSRKVSSLSECFYMYRQRSSSIIHSNYSTNRIEVLNAVQELLDVPEIAGEPNRKRLLEKRILRTKGFVMQDLLRKCSNEDLSINKNIIVSWRKDYRKNARYIIFTKDEDKALRVLALYSFMSYKKMVKEYRVGWISKLYANKYLPYD